MVEVGRAYTQEDIGRTFRTIVGARISMAPGSEDIVLLAGPPVEETCRANIWDGEVFVFSGEGDEGDLEWTSGNKAVRDHVTSGQDLHLFAEAEGGCRYNGRLVCRSCEECTEPDGHGHTQEVLPIQPSPGGVGDKRISRMGG